METMVENQELKKRQLFSAQVDLSKFKDKDFELQDIYIDKMMEVKYPTGESNRSKNPNNPTSSNITDMFKTR